MSAYYNEIDAYAAQWLRNLIAASLIPHGEVDERSIASVTPADLRQFGQCHFFAGIGGWALAARLAGWPDDRELWTGSAPCQPFSVAGKGKAQADDRHLWPHLFRLVGARRPAVLMGEQVAAAVGKDWLDGVFADLEGIDYACGAAVVPACAVDAPHRRDRLWFVGHSRRPVRERDARGLSEAQARVGSANGSIDGHLPVGLEHAGEGDCGAVADAWRCSDIREVRPANHVEPKADGPANRFGGRRDSCHAAWTNHERIIGHDGKARRVEPGIRLLAHGVPARVGKLRAYGNAIVPQIAAEVIGAYMDCRP